MSDPPWACLLFLQNKRFVRENIHAEGPAFFCWIPKLFGKRVISTIHGLDWAREKWQSGLGSKFI